MEEKFSYSASPISHRFCCRHRRRSRVNILKTARLQPAKFGLVVFMPCRRAPASQDPQKARPASPVLGMGTGAYRTK